MCHELALGVEFSAWLLGQDEQLTAALQRRGCPHCGGRLDRADYPRKPRGVYGAAEAWFERRLSLCCARRGCRKRLTPPSLRFIGGKVYVAWVVVMGAAAATVVGPWQRRRRQRRWRAYLRRWGATSAAAARMAARFAPGLAAGGPEQWLRCFAGHNPWHQAAHLLALIAQASLPDFAPSGGGGRGHAEDGG